MGVGAVGSNNYQTYFLDYETMSLAQKGPDGEMEEVSAAEKEKVLARAGFKLSSEGQLLDVISGDSFSLKDDSNIMQGKLSVGGKPIFNDGFAGADANHAPDVRAACELLQNMSGSNTSLMLQQMLVLLRINQEDERTNNEALMVADNMKLQAKDLENTAKKQQFEAEKDQAGLELFASCASSLIKMAASTAKFVSDKKKDPDKDPEEMTKKQKMAQNFVRHFTNVGENTVGLWSTFTELHSVNSGAKKEGHEASMREQEAQKSSEVINQLQNALKEGRRNVQNTHDKALQLLQSVAEREVENIKAMTNA